MREGGGIANELRYVNEVEVSHPILTMIDSFFSELREVASLVDGVESRLRDREALDLDGPKHHALQQAALYNLKADVVKTKNNMKTLQPTVVNLQKFGRLNEISGHLLSLHRRRIEALKEHMAQFGYEEPPPKKIHKLSDDFERDDGRVRDALATATVVKKPASASSSSNNLPSRPEDCDAAAPADDSRQDSKNHDQYDSEPKEERMETNDFESADSHLHHLDVPSKISGNLEFPKSPPCPILHSTSNTVIANSVVQHRASSSPSAPSSLTMNRCEDEDDSVLAMELPPTPVCPEMTWQPNRAEMPNPALSSISSVSSIGSSSSSITKTPASSPLVRTPTPPILLSAVKRAFDVTSIDFSGLEDGEVFHTGLTPKTPELHCFMPSHSASMSVSTTSGYPDTPFEGRATPSSPGSQQSFESLKRALKFNADPTASSSALASGYVMKPVSFVEFEQKQQKVDGISRETLNGAIKALNAVFREKEVAKEPLDLPQAQVVSLFNEDNDLRLGTKIILMLLKFKRIDCRTANGQSYVSPFSEADDSVLDATANDD